MTLHSPVTPEPPLRNEAAEALELFDLATTILRKWLDEAQADPAAVPARELAATTKDVGAALKTLILERQHVEKLRRDAGALAAGQDLDLGRARDEIGLRLACLRNAAAD